MVLMDARDFLAEFAPCFVAREVAEWAWAPGDDDFGKLAQWVVRPASLDEAQAEVMASVDLQLTQLQLVVSERFPGGDAQVVFSVLVQFEDQTLAVESEPAEFTEAAIRAAIQGFNDRTVSS